MTADVVQLAAADFQEAMDFLDLVFGGYRPHDFENLLPSVYRPTDGAMACLAAIREGERLRAIVGAHPRTWRLADRALRLAGVGGVSTHRKSRGRGYMRRLMEHCVSTMAATGVQVSHLGGQRQRYQHFGYERCGRALQFTASRANLGPALADAAADVRFEVIDAQRIEWLARAQALHESQPACCLRPADEFLDRLRSWHYVPHAALDGQGRMVGYLTANADGTRIGELVTESDESFDRAVRSWVAQRGNSTLELPPLATAPARLLAGWCETVTVQPTGNWRIFDWPAVVGALLCARHRAAPLLAGSIQVGIQSKGTLALRVDTDGTECAWSDAAPQVSCDELAAMRLLFGPARPSETLALPAAAALLDQWCPLPLFWPHQDAV